MNSYLKLLTDVGTEDELIKLEDQKAQCQIDAEETAFDDQLTLAVSASRHAIENQIGRPIGEQQFEMGLKCWPECSLVLPRSPLILVQTIKYTKRDGTVVTWYDGEASPLSNPGITIETASDPGEIFLNFGTTWPTDVLAEGYPIKITFIAGMETIPDDLKNALLICGANLFMFRESITDRQTYEVAKSLEWLYKPYVFSEMR